MLALNYYICCFTMKSITLMHTIFLHGIHTGLDHSLHFPPVTWYFSLEGGHVYAIQVMERKMVKIG